MLLKGPIGRNDFMDDPLSALLQSLQAVFQLAIKRNGQYTYKEIQHLEEAVHAYSSEQTTPHFIRLNKALRQALTHIEKWRINMGNIQKALDTLAQKHAQPKFAYSKLSITFQFSANNQSGNLAAWIHAKSGKVCANLNQNQLTQILVDYRNHSGFSFQLNTQLKKDPDFLFNLIVQSEKNLINIAKTRLILYLTDEQLARVLMKHLSTLVPPLQQKDEEEINTRVETLNEILSHGRSISTLLRNTDAKAVLDGAELFCLYQYYQQKEQPTPNGP